MQLIDCFVIMRIEGELLQPYAGIAPALNCRLELIVAPVIDLALLELLGKGKQELFMTHTDHIVE